MPFFKLCLVAASILALGVPPASTTQSIPDRRFGVVETFDDPASAAAIGAGWTRARFAWSDLQPNNDGEWNNAFFSDDMLAAELAAGREVAGLIVNTPFWALKDSAIPGVPRGLYLPESDPGNVWATFVRQIVARYSGRIDHWIIWNEPDIWDPAYPGRTWGGTVAEFFQLQRVAYNVAKETNPDAVIHLGAFTYFWDVNYGRTPFFSLLMDEIQRDPQAAAHNYYFDVASANLYFRVDNIYDLVAWHHGQMQARGFDKPIWLTETNAAPSSDPGWPVANPTFPISLDEQAAFVPQAFAMALAAGASRIAVFKMVDTPGDRAANPEPFGLAREDGSRRPAFTAYQVAVNYMAGFTGATLDHRDDAYVQITVQRGEATTTVLWARSPASVQVHVPASSAQAVLADAFGGKRTIAAQDGMYTVDLPGCTQPTCAIGGAPRLIVEGAPAATIPPVNAIPGELPDQPDSQPTLELAGQQGATSTPEPSATPASSPTPAVTATVTPGPTATPPSATPAVVQQVLSGYTDAERTLPGPDAMLIAIGLLMAAILVAFLLAHLAPRA